VRTRLHGTKKSLQELLAFATERAVPISSVVMAKAPRMIPELK
jgi:hypothetical protein